MKSPGDWYALFSLTGICDSSLTPVLVPTMDWPSRRTRHSNLCIRSGRSQRQSGRWSRVLDQEAYRRRVLKSPCPSDASLCSLREPSLLCLSAVLPDTRSAVPRNSRLTVYEHCRHLKCWSEAVLEFEEAYGGCQSACYSVRPYRLTPRRHIC